MEFLRKVPLKCWIIFVAAITVSLLSYFRFFNNYELISYDLRLKLRPPLKASKDILLVEISDDTIKNLGKWPLPRDFHASLIDVLKEFGAKEIIFDILFSEPTLYDEAFSQSVKAAGNVYLPVAFYIEERTKKDYQPPESREILGDIYENFKEHIAGSGHINTFVDTDGKTRRIPLFIKYQGKIFAHLGLKAACDSLGLDIEKLELKGNRIIIDKDLFLPVSSGTSFMVNYPDRWKNSFTHLSYFGILKAYSDINKSKVPQIDLSILKNKICFIGLTATGTSDLRPNPLENIYPMLGLQASVFNSIIQKEFITDTGPLRNTFLNLTIFFLSLILCLKFLPLRAFLFNTILGLGYFLTSICIFIFWGIWIDLFFPLFIIVLTYLASTIHKFLEEARKRQILEKELEIARTIQSNFLPQDIKEVPGLSISSFMQPTRFVAGDLYDIVMLSEKRVGVFIGDVSGKGIPAALIMAQTISQFRIFSRQRAHYSTVLEHLNKELYGKCGGRFVTCIYIVVDVNERKMYASSAGHSPLFIYKRSKSKVLELELSAGLPLGVTEDAQYKQVQYDIEKGDTVVVFTDGVSEARNRKNQEFGTENIKNIILENAALSSEKILDIIKEKVFKFSYRCAQHDDITLIVLSVGK
jgi:CHASE2 domain-containing sensor protein